MPVSTMSSHALRARQTVLSEAGVLKDLDVIDVRSKSEFASGSVPGARNVPLEHIAEHAEHLRDSSREIVLVCRTGQRARRAGQALHTAGLATISVLDGGLEAYAVSAPSAARGPAELPAAMRAGWGLERQVRLLAGALVASSIVVSVWRPRARFLAGAVGTGLTVAALTDTCAMGRALSALPFNRSTTPHPARS